MSVDPRSPPVRAATLTNTSCNLPELPPAPLAHHSAAAPISFSAVIFYDYVRNPLCALRASDRRRSAVYAVRRKKTANKH